jgi:hypothetical protein
MRLRPSDLLAGLVLSAACLSSDANAGEPAVSERSLAIAVSGAASDLVLSHDEESVYWIGVGDEGAFVYAASLRTGTLSRLRSLPDVVPPTSDLRLLAVPHHSNALVFGYKCCIETNGWEMWLLDLKQSEDVLLSERVGASDGDVLFSPSGDYFLTGTGFGCVGGGFNCMATTFSVFSSRTGAPVHTFNAPLNRYTVPYSDLFGDPTAVGSTTRQDSSLEAIGWCPKDVLVVKADGRPEELHQRSRKGRWSSRVTPSPCGIPRHPPTNPGPEYVLSGTRWRVVVKRPASAADARHATRSISVSVMPASPGPQGRQ